MARRGKRTKNIIDPAPATKSYKHKNQTAQKPEAAWPIIDASIPTSQKGHPR